ncbi:MAG: histidine kinase [Mucilaginibacter sp.]|nr:histidine kinase [Mucilaginibacter sp.]
MKVEIRKYERLLITFLGSITILEYILQGLNISPVYTAGFDQYNITHPSHPFYYAANIFLPRVIVVILFLAVYFWVNLYTIPQLLRANRRLVYIYLWTLIQFLSSSYLLAIGVNAASWYAHPDRNNYGEFSLFALFGYNENPLVDLWSGFDRALIILLIYSIYAGIREYVISKIEKNGTKSNYRILIANQFSASLCIVLLLPKLVSVLHLINDDSLYHAYFVFIPSVMLVYFSNTYWLFPSYAKTNGVSFNLVSRLGISTFFYSILMIGFISRTGLSPKVLLVNWVIQLLVTTPVTWTLYQLRKDKISTLRGVEMALSRSTADLQFLRSQINPHFLFNVLNTIYGMALVDESKRSANAIQMLGDMMRFMLDDNHLDFIPLSNEINYLQNYIALQKLRVQDSDEIEISENITTEDCAFEIVPMLLIPFVENAFKHGINLGQKSWISIMLTCDHNGIRFNVRNSIHEADINDPEQKHSGIGLQNVRERLNMFYPGRHRLTCETTDKAFHVDLIIKPKKSSV